MSAEPVTTTRPIAHQSDRELQAQLLGIDSTIQPTNRRIGTWLRQFFVVSVILAIPVGYYLGYIGVIGLNRIGIILNFCAGFMLAPELIGQKRLQWLEDQHLEAI